MARIENVTAVRPPDGGSCLVRRAILLLLLLGCAKTEKPAAVDLIHEVASEVRTKPRIEVDLKLPQDNPTPADLTMQRSLEDRIERENIGRLVSSGSHPGSLFITVEVEQTADAMDKLRTLLRSAGVLPQASFRVIAGEK
jgi:hypothetical protein